MNTPSTLSPDKPAFDGVTFLADRDGSRLGKQLQAVKAILLDQNPHTLREIAEITGYPESSIGSRIRDCRKDKFGSWIIDRKHIANGLHTYQLKAVPMPQATD